MSNLKKGIVTVFIANMINMVLSVLTSFVLPKYLSVETYSYIKTYQLYVSMLGILHLGYIDGMFLKYGGVDLDKLNYKDVDKNISTFRLFQVFVTALTFLCIVLFVHDYVYVVVALVILPVNLTAYYKSFFQSIGEFKRYSRLMNATTGITFLANFILLLCIKSDDYRLYISMYLLINLFIWVALEYLFRKICKYKFHYFYFSVQELVANIKDGILLMLGNFANTILTSLDRWFVKALLTTVDFAHYSFACSMETMINVAVTPITVTLYNYFCKNPGKERIILVRNAITVVASYLIACAFPAKFILEVYLTKYIESSKILFYLFAAQLFYIIIKSIYVNLYKAMHMQKKYFIKLIIVIISGFLLNIICFMAIHTKEAFAIGTLVSAFIWYILCIFDFKYYGTHATDIIYMFVNLSAFLICGYLFEAVVGCLIYLIILTGSSMVLMRREMKFLTDYIYSMLPSNT